MRAGPLHRLIGRNGVCGGSYFQVAAHDIVLAALLHGAHIHALVARLVGELDRTGYASHGRQPAKGIGGIAQRDAGALVAAYNSIFVGLPCHSGAVAIEIARSVVGNRSPRRTAVCDTAVELEPVGIARGLIPLQEDLIGVVALGGIER